MGNELKIFENSEFGAVRTHIGGDGGIWFVAKDVCDILELGNVGQALTRLDEDEKKQLGSIISNDVGLDVSKGGRDFYFISESGFYSLVLRSDKPKAKPFQKWVTSEVLPAIREHGFYLHAPVPAQLLRSLEREMKKQRRELELTHKSFNKTFLRWDKAIKGKDVECEELKQDIRNLLYLLDVAKNYPLENIHQFLRDELYKFYKSKKV